MLQIFKYDPSFGDVYIKEREKIASLLEGGHSINHIGSTAIHGMDGKGVIDIMVAFKTIAEIKSAVLLLKNEYFIDSDKIERGDRIFMTSSDVESKPGDIHMHLVLDTSDGYLNAILFRDYLIKHTDIKQAYADLKYKLLGEVNGDRAEYTKKKSSFIKEVIALAKNESKINC